MQDHVSRLVGLDGFRVKCVIEDGDQLDLEVELVTRAQSCPHCTGTDLEVHERPVVAVRDLPLAGRPATLRWRKRRYRCKECRRTHTETCEAAPSRQRLTGRFRSRLAERVRSGGAHAEIAREECTTRYQVTRALRIAAAEQSIRGHRRSPAGSPSMRPLTARAQTTWRRSSQTSIADACTRCSTDEKTGEARQRIENEGAFIELGSARLDPGRHEAELRFGGADLHPGSGGFPRPRTGPLLFAPAGSGSGELVAAPLSEPRRLCGREWDWIEVFSG